MAGSIIRFIALLWTLALCVLAVRLTRRRLLGVKPPAVEPRGEPARSDRSEPSPLQGLGPARPTPAPRTLPRRVRVAAIVVGGVVASALALDVVWLSHNRDAIAPVGQGVLAPDFELPRIDGTQGRVSLQQLRGKVVLLDFWARWCPPCLALRPTLHDIYAARQSQGVEFLSISSEGSMADRAGIEASSRQNPTPYPSLLDDQEVGGLYGVVSLPHLVLIGRDGVIRRVMVGQRRKAEIDTAIQRALDN